MFVMIVSYIDVKNLGKKSMPEWNEIDSALMKCIQIVI
jgi:hypothetical protein